jgi:hypothetical protein
MLETDVIWLIIMARINNGFTRSVRRHIRHEKARIRKQIVDLSEREQKIAALYTRFRGGEVK